MHTDKNSKEPKEFTLYKVQDNLVSAIKQHIADIQENNSIKHNWIPQTIGIEGTWGSGKSNVILKLAKQDTIQIKNENYKTHFFTFNIWENQVEPIKQIFLKNLINDLVESKILRGSTTIKIKDNEITREWAKIFDTITATRTYQKKFIFSPIAVCAFIFPILLGLEWFIQIIKVNINAFMTVFILFFLIYFCLWLSDKTHKLFYKSLYCESLTIELNNNVIKQLIWNISEEIKNKKELLIITFDNSDRCNLEKIEETLTFIYSIFSEESFDNIWVILTYDYQRLSEIIRTNSFSKNLKKRAPMINNQINDKKEDSYNSTIEKNDNYIIDSYLTKVLYSIFRVPDPANIDYELTFNNFYHTVFNIKKQKKEAQGTLTELASPLYKIYRIEHNKLIFRELISFINDLKIINNCLTDKSISLLSIAIFILNKRSLINQDINYLLNFQLNTSYIEILNSENLNINQVRIQLIAIVYNIDCKRVLFNIIESIIESNLEKDKNYKATQATYSTTEEIIVDYLTQKILFYEIIPRNNQKLILNAERFDDLLFNINLINLDKNEYIYCWQYYCKLYGIDFCIRKLIKNLAELKITDTRTRKNITALNETNNKISTILDILRHLTKEKKQQLRNPNFVCFFSYEIYALYTTLNYSSKNIINLLQQIEEIYFVNHQQVFNKIINSKENQAEILADYFLATYVYSNNMLGFKNKVEKYVQEWDINKIQEYFWKALCLVSTYSTKKIDNIVSDNNYTIDYKSMLENILIDNKCVEFILKNINKKQPNINLVESFTSYLKTKLHKGLLIMLWEDNIIPIMYILKELIENDLLRLENYDIWDTFNSLWNEVIASKSLLFYSDIISYITSLLYIYRKADPQSSFSHKKELIDYFKKQKDQNLIQAIEIYVYDIIFYSDIIFTLEIFSNFSINNISVGNGKASTDLKTFYSQVRKNEYNKKYQFILKEYADIVRYYSTKEETLEILKNKNEDDWFYDFIKEALETSS